MNTDPQTAAIAQPGDETACCAAVSALLRLRHCLSYNDSYCGEPAGEVKRAVVRWSHLGATPLPVSAQESKGEREAFTADMIAAGARDYGDNTWEWDDADFLFRFWKHARATPAGSASPVDVDLHHLRAHGHQQVEGLSKTGPELTSSAATAGTVAADPCAAHIPTETTQHITD